jgi:amidohydrolase
MDIWNEVLAVEDYVIRCRRYIHENPELSDQEDNTIAFILQELTAMGVECVDVPGGGVMGFIHGSKPGKSVLLRADIDALPVQEAPNNLKQPKVCVSKVPGVAHMCGHDAHTAMLLGAAKILQSHRQEIPGEIVLYFERGEEHGNGDYYMNKYLQDHHIHVDSAWAQHVSAKVPVGQVSVISGGAYAGTAGLGATILGENALACGVAVINSLNTARMRDMTPYERVTLSVNQLQYRNGVCKISGTCRYYDFYKAGVPMRKAIERIITETVKAYGCTTEKPVRSRAGNRAVMNHPVCCDIIRKALVPLIGAENVI